MEERLVRLCSSTELPRGASIRFPLDPPRPHADEAFAYRAGDGTLRAWVNVCPHRAQPIDLGDGRLFNAAGEIECQADGARFDVIFCRGVLEDMETSQRARVLDNLERRLVDDGCLFLGPDERIEGDSIAFRAVAGRKGLFVKSPTTLRRAA